jgi:nucleoside-diphosphate-sugar epimerase
MPPSNPQIPDLERNLKDFDSVARAHLVAAERGRSGERYLLADEHVSMRDLAAALLRESGADRSPPPTGPAPLFKMMAATLEPLARSFGFPPLVARGQLSFLLWNARVDATKARRELDYTTVPLAEGLRRTLESFRRQQLI